MGPVATGHVPSCAHGGSSPPGANAQGGDVLWGPLSPNSWPTSRWTLRSHLEISQVKAVLFKDQGPPPIWGEMAAFPLSCQTQCQETPCDGGGVGGGAGPSGTGTEADAGAEADMHGHVRGHEVHREEATSALFRAPSPVPHTARAFSSIQKWGLNREATDVAVVQGRGCKCCASKPS